MIVGFVLMVPFLLFVPETRQDVLLLRRAKRLRKETGNQELYAASELQKRTVKEILMETIIRPVGDYPFYPSLTAGGALTKGIYDCTLQKCSSPNPSCFFWVFGMV
jgi:hypothetical protein